MEDNDCYNLIKDYYGTRRAKRSGVKLINHIDQGLIILDSLESRLETLEAYCLHPLLQENSSFVQFESIFAAWMDKNSDATLPWAAVMLAMEYRAVANSYLSTRSIEDVLDISISPDLRVQEMLIADKIQNRKDFEIYHISTHPRSKELQEYFKNWMRRLNITEEFYLHTLTTI